MRARLRALWARAWSSYWLIPSVMTGAAIALAIGLVAVDRRLAESGIGLFGWVYEGGVDGARAVLQVVAGSMITVAGVVFSITIVVLTLMSQQFGPRLLARFMRDTGSQVVLGTFVSSYVYCLMVLRTVHGGDDGAAFVPQVAVAFAILLALAGVAVLIYFIHHTAASIRVDNLVARVGLELAREVEREFVPGPLPPAFRAGRHPKEATEPFGGPEERGFVVPATASGYVDEIDLGGLVDLAREHGAILRLRHRRGGFVGWHAELARVYPESAGGDDLVERVNGLVMLGRQRSGKEDVLLLARQLVEVALRALSPGFNDPFTAIACLDQLGNGLAHAASRVSPSVYHFERETLRLITDEVTFEALVDLSFNQIRQFSRTHPTLMIHLLHVIARVGANAEPTERRAYLLEHARMIRRQAEEVPEERDRREIEERFESVARALAGEA